MLRLAPHELLLKMLLQTVYRDIGRLAYYRILAQPHGGWEGFLLPTDATPKLLEHLHLTNFGYGGVEPLHSGNRKGACHAIRY